MKWLNCEKLKLVFIGVVAAMVLGGGRQGKAEIIISEPTNLGPVINDAYNVQNSDFSHDGLQLYFAVWNRPNGFGSGDIYMTERETLSSPWQEPVNLGTNVNSSGSQVEPSISSDGLELYFGCWDDYILRVCTRPSKDAPWSRPVRIGPPVGSIRPAMEIGSNDAWTPEISADGLSLYFSSTRFTGGHGGTDIWVTTRATIADPWTEPVNLGPNVNSGAGDWSPSISDDGLTLVFSREFQSMWATTRKSIYDDWEPAVQLGFNPPPVPGDPAWTRNFFGAALSPDGSTLYYDASKGWGGYGTNDIWQVNFIPIIDFNSDEIIDADDLCIMVDNWHTNSNLCDIAPLPLGDGFVDVQDLIVLAEHLFKEVFPFELIGYWKLEETEGDIAYNSVSDNYGVLNGNPTWQPDSGWVGGALQFDGIDDYISTDFVLDPADGSFSVFAWIQGGGPGQVIIAQRTGAGNIWLGLDAQIGYLMTGLQPPSTSWVATKNPLVSESIISDEQWHHVGFVWDGSYRILYADGIEVAKDKAAQNPLKSATGGLYIGAGKSLSAGTFFSGLIDDVRIYNVALTAEEIATLAQ